ncbi:MAG: VOC family protein [Actinomycetota bacterium]|nr:VOC family protein [Actinomycetota bacterium]
MRLDHISYACTASELPDVVQRIGSDLSATFRDGGRHPQFGTRNFILPMANGCYIEVVSALDHPASDKAAFGRAVNHCATNGGGWMSWAISVDNIKPYEQRLGREAVAGHRILPDGQKLEWKQLGVLNVMENPQLPFFVEWVSSADKHPSVGASNVTVERIEIAGDPNTVSAYIDENFMDVMDGVYVEWVEAENPGVIAVTFTTPNGTVRID